MNLQSLAQQATAALLDHTPITIRHPAGWTRPNGWPVPIQRNRQPAADGSLTQNYRPIVVLEWVGQEVEKAHQPVKATA